MPLPQPPFDASHWMMVSESRSTGSVSTGVFHGSVAWKAKPPVDEELLPLLDEELLPLLDEELLVLPPIRRSCSRWSSRPRSRSRPSRCPWPSSPRRLRREGRRGRFPMRPGSVS